MGRTVRARWLDALVITSIVMAIVVPVARAAGGNAPVGDPVVTRPTDGIRPGPMQAFPWPTWSPDSRSVLGSWLQECGANIVTDTKCQRRLPTTAPTNPTDGFAGRLVRPQ